MLGGGSERLVTRIGTAANGRFDPLARLGGSLLQNRGIGPREGSAHVFRGETVPPAATIVARRRSTPLFGLSLVDATPDATFMALAAQQAARNDGGEDTQALTDFMTLLGAPPRGPITADAAAGEAVFNRIGCNACHVPSLQTGSHPNPALNRVTYAPYSA